MIVIPLTQEQQLDLIADLLNSDHINALYSMAKVLIIEKNTLRSELDEANSKLERIRKLCDLSEGNVTSLRYVLNLIRAILDGRDTP